MSFTIKLFPDKKQCCREDGFPSSLLNLIQLKVKGDYSLHISEEGKVFSTEENIKLKHIFINAKKDRKEASLGRKSGTNRTTGYQYDYKQSPLEELMPQNYSIHSRGDSKANSLPVSPCQNCHPHLYCNWPKRLCLKGECHWDRHVETPRKGPKSAPESSASLSIRLHIAASPSNGLIRTLEAKVRL